MSFLSTRQALVNWSDDLPLRADLRAQLLEELERAEGLEAALHEIHDTMGVDAWGIADDALAAAPGEENR